MASPSARSSSSASSTSLSAWADSCIGASYFFPAFLAFFATLRTTFFAAFLGAAFLALNFFATLRTAFFAAFLGAFFFLALTFFFTTFLGASDFTTGAAGDATGSATGTTSTGGGGTGAGAAAELSATSLGSFWFSMVSLLARLASLPESIAR